MSDHRGICRWPRSRVWQVTFEFCRLHLGRLRGVHFPSPDAGEPQACDPDDQPSRTAVRRGRRRQKIFPKVWVERVAPELMFGMMIRASERWRSVRAAHFEGLQMEVFRRVPDEKTPEADRLRPIRRNEDRTPQSSPEMEPDLHYWPCSINRRRILHELNISSEIRPRQSCQVLQNPVPAITIS